MINKNYLYRYIYIIAYTDIIFYLHIININYINLNYLKNLGFISFKILNLFLKSFSTEYYDDNFHIISIYFYLLSSFTWIFSLSLVILLFYLI